MKNSQIHHHDDHQDHDDHHDHDTSHLPALGAKVGAKCNFCDSTAGLELHHIIPRSIGGTDDPNNLITVCNDHHAILHGMKRRGNISALTKNGLAKAKSQGVKLGNPNRIDRVDENGKLVLSLTSARQLSAKALGSKADALAKHMRPAIERMRRDGMTYAAIADEFNKDGIETARGGAWEGTTVRNMVLRFNS